MKVKEKWLLYSSNLWNFADGLLGPLFTVFTQKIGGDILEVTYAWAAYLFTTGILTMFVGKFSDKYKNKELLCFLGYFLNVICIFGYLFVSNTFELLLIQFGLGLSLALANPTWDALFLKYNTKNNEASVYGKASGEAKIFTAIAVLIGGVIVKYFSFNVLFVVMGTIQIFATYFQSKFLGNR